MVLQWQGGGHNREEPGAPGAPATFALAFPLQLQTVLQVQSAAPGLCSCLCQPPDSWETSCPASVMRVGEGLEKGLRGWSFSPFPLSSLSIRWGSHSPHMPHAAHPHCCGTGDTLRVTWGWRK